MQPYICRAQLCMPGEMPLQLQRKPYQKIYACDNLASEEVQKRALYLLQLCVMLELLPSKNKARLQKRPTQQALLPQRCLRPPCSHCQSQGLAQSGTDLLFYCVKGLLFPRSSLTEPTLLSTWTRLAAEPNFESGTCDSTPNSKRS